MKVLKLDPAVKRRYIIGLFTFWLPLAAAVTLYCLIKTNATEGVVGLYMQLWRLEYIILSAVGLICFIVQAFRNDGDENYAKIRLMHPMEMLAIAIAMAYLDIFEVFYIFTAAN